VNRARLGEKLDLPLSGGGTARVTLEAAEYLPSGLTGSSSDTIDDGTQLTLLVSAPSSEGLGVNVVSNQPFVNLICGGKPAGLGIYKYDHPGNLFNLEVASGETGRGLVLLPAEDDCIDPAVTINPNLFDESAPGTGLLSWSLPVEALKAPTVPSGGTVIARPYDLSIGQAAGGWITGTVSVAFVVQGNTLLQPPTLDIRSTELITSGPTYEAYIMTDRYSVVTTNSIRLGSESWPPIPSDVVLSGVEVGGPSGYFVRFKYAQAAQPKSIKISSDNGVVLQFDLENVPKNFAATDVSNYQPLSTDAIQFKGPSEQVRVSYTARCQKIASGFDTHYSVLMFIENSDVYEDQLAWFHVNPLLVYFGDGRLLQVDGRVTGDFAEFQLGRQFAFNVGPATKNFPFFVLRVDDKIGASDRPIALFAFDETEGQFDRYRLDCP